MNKMSENIQVIGKARKLRISKKKIMEFCKRHHIRRFSLFGSVLREDFTPDSDVDMLVEFKTGHTSGLLKFVEMKEELSSLFDGRKVDLRTPHDLSRCFRDDVLRAKEVLYSEA